MVHLIKGPPSQLPCISSYTVLRVPFGNGIPRLGNLRIHVVTQFGQFDRDQRLTILEVELVLK